MAHTQSQRRNAKRQKKGATRTNEGSSDEVLALDVANFRRQHNLAKAEDVTSDETTASRDVASLERFSEVEVNVLMISSVGDGIGISKGDKLAFVVPFTLPGDKVKARVIRHVQEAHYWHTDLVEILEPSPQRDQSLVRCQYFGKCGGCQLQMLKYEDQLQHKKSIIEKAYRNFSTLAPEVVPPVLDTIGSPREYGYRTKLTPHFDGPPRSKQREARRSGGSVFSSVPPIGFMMKGSRKNLDVEDCPIGTYAVREGLTVERKRVTEDISVYTKGATLLLRESTKRADARPIDEASGGSLSNGEAKQQVKQVETKTCITDQKAIATEFVDDFVFQNTAGSFFQNNNSILPSFTEYIRSRIVPSSSGRVPPLKYLIDAYCGSGLFTVTLSSLFEYSMGIDVADTSIAAAKKNAELNNVKNASFLTADAAALFDKTTYPADKTAVVIDPPRKGCDDPFLKQLLAFGPKRVVYVSCNVHTQARDVGVLVEGTGDTNYEIESLQGFDFFPQTGHVEGVAVLNRCERITHFQGQGSK